MMVSEEKFRNKFCNTEMRTLKFFLLSLVSMNFWMYFWLYSFVKTINKHEGREVISPSLPIISMVSHFFSLLFEEGGLESAVIMLFFCLVECILLIYISFKSRSSLEAMFANSGMARRLSGIWCFFFPGMYQYYTIYNIEEYYKWHSEDEEEEDDEDTKGTPDGAQARDKD